VSKFSTTVHRRRDVFLSENGVRTRDLLLVGLLGLLGQLILVVE
jgi:hypothetical protein